MWSASWLFAVGKTCFTWSKRAEIFCLTVYYKQLVNGGTRCDPYVTHSYTQKGTHIYTNTYASEGLSWIWTAACGNDNGEQTNRSLLRSFKLKMCLFLHGGNVLSLCLVKVEGFRQTNSWDLLLFQNRCSNKCTCRCYLYSNSMYPSDSNLESLQW